MSIGNLETEADLRRFIEAQLGTMPQRLEQVVSKAARTKPKAFTVATLPPAAEHTGEIVYVSDAAAGSKLQYSDGASWVVAG